MLHRKIEINFNYKTNYGMAYINSNSVSKRLNRSGHRDLIFILLRFVPFIFSFLHFLPLIFTKTLNLH